MLKGFGKPSAFGCALKEVFRQFRESCFGKGPRKNECIGVGGKKPSGEFCEFSAPPEAFGEVRCPGVTVKKLLGDFREARARKNAREVFRVNERERVTRELS